MERSISRVQLVPTHMIENSLRVCLFQFTDLLLDVLFRKIKKLSMINELFYKIVHRRNITTQQFVNTTISLVLYLQDITDTSVRVLIFF